MKFLFKKTVTPLIVNWINFSVPFKEEHLKNVQICFYYLFDIFLIDFNLKIVTVNDPALILEISEVNARAYLEIKIF